MHVLRLAVVAVLAFQAMGASVYAQSRLTRTYTHRDGLIAPPVWALAQDRAGFLWVGSQAGLFRYDGNAFHRWLPEELDAAVLSVAASDRGKVAAIDERGHIALIGTDGTHRLIQPAGTLERAQYLLAFDDAERLWTVRSGEALYYDGGRWTVVPRSTLGAEWAVQVRRADGGGIYVVTNGGIWLVRPPAARRVVFLPQVVDLVELDGRLLVLTFDSRLHEVRDGVARVLVYPEDLPIPPPLPRGIALTLRRGTLWMALDRFLVARRPGEPLEVLGSDEGISSGGPLLVDREGSLWMGTFSELLQLPEPETRLWSDEHGLPSRHTRFVVRSGDHVWVATWQGAAYISRDSSGWRARHVQGLSGNRICSTDGQTIWASGDRGILRIHARTVDPVHPARVSLMSCSAGSDGSAWLATSAGLWHAPGGAEPPRRIPDIPDLAGGSMIDAVFEDSQGTLWIAVPGEVCHAPATRIRQAAPASWRCDQTGDTEKNTSFLEPAPGTLWLSTMRRGILVREADAWRPLEQNQLLTTSAVFEVSASPVGGIWIVGHGTIERIAIDSGGTWTALERPRSWHGVPIIGAQDVLEDDDGTLWLTTSLGVVQLPPVARFEPIHAPPVELVSARMDDDTVALDAGLELPYSRNRLTLEFAALSYRDRSLLRYEMRMSPTANWTEVRGQPTLRWVDLSPGDYQVEVRASLDGKNWSAKPASFAFTVLPPWYRTTDAFLVFGLSAALLIWGAYRLRMAYLLGLERQRTRIAMDLHDEVGSGLGSIGILSGVLATNAVRSEDGRALATRISRATEELGASLDDIIWSLDPRMETLEELAGRLVEHGNRLFADDDIDFIVDLPSTWPDHSLSLAVRRNILLIGLEALHNAARHSGARTVRLTLGPADGWWRLTISDDGSGLQVTAGDPAHTGRGLDGMRKRATEIGAELQIGASPGNGTTVWVRFPVRRASWPRFVRRRRTVRA